MTTWALPLLCSCPCCIPLQAALTTAARQATEFWSTCAAASQAKASLQVSLLLPPVPARNSKAGHMTLVILYICICRQTCLFCVHATSALCAVGGVNMQPNYFSWKVTLTAHISGSGSLPEALAPLVKAQLLAFLIYTTPALLQDQLQGAGQAPGQTQDGPDQQQPSDFAKALPGPCPVLRRLVSFDPSKPLLTLPSMWANSQPAIQLGVFCKCSCQNFDSVACAAFCTCNAATMNKILLSHGQSHHCVILCPAPSTTWYCCLQRSC